MKKYALMFFDKNIESDLDNAVNELSELLKTLEICPYSYLYQNVDKINPDTYFGSGKLQEALAIIKLSEVEYSYFVTNFPLTANQKENIQDVLGIEVIDRTMVILEIFKINANSKEAKLQVEISTLQYLASSLVSSKAGYAQVTSGTLANKGKGEKQIELNKRQIREKIQSKKKELEQIKKSRKTSRNLRKHNQIPQLAVVGYTNAGKSSLINALLSLTKNKPSKDVYVKWQPFATLNTFTRLIDLHNYPSFIISDTVGFIKKLPTFLVNAFHSTLEEIKEADLLVEVVDISSKQYEEDMKVTEEILKNLEANDIPRVRIYNKLDLIDSKYPFLPKKNEMFTSLKGNIQDIKEIYSFLLDNITSSWETYTFEVPYDFDLRVFQKENFVKKIIEKENGYQLTASINPKYINKYKDLVS